jgi:inner membrane transporter RhtA
MDTTAAPGTPTTAPATTAPATTGPTTTAPATTGPTTTTPATAGSRRWPGLVLMLGSGLSNQLGAATGSLAFGVIGPVGVVAVRQWVAGLILLAVVVGTMNLSLYSAIERLGLGLAVTLEFLGPLSVALAASRRRADIGCAVVAGAGIVVLARPQPTTDYLGIGLGLLAALCWAAYILLNRVIGRRLPGAQGPATAAGLSALLFVPVGIAQFIAHPPTVAALACAAVAGVLSSAVPLLTDLLALRRVPAHFFGIFMSINPVLAAVIGLAVLGQSLAGTEWLAIAAIVTANAVSAGKSSARTGRAGAGAVAPVDAARGAGLADHHRRQRQRGGQPVPDPAGEHLAGRVLQAGDVVQVVVVKLVADRRERLADVGEVHHPAGAGRDLAADVHLDPERVPVQPRALVARGHVRQPVRGLEAELPEDLHHRIPRYLWVCTLSCHRGWARQYSTAARVLAVRSGPSIGCSSSRPKPASSNRSGGAPGCG